MSQRVLGASPFLAGVRRLREEQDRLSRGKHQEVTILVDSLDRVLDACGVDDVGTRDKLAGLEADDVEVVIRPRSARLSETQSSE